MPRPLTYPAIDENLMTMLVPLANELDDLVVCGEDCHRERDHFNALAGTSIDDPVVFHFTGACSAEEFVRGELARRHIGEYAGLDDEDLLDLLRSIREGTRAEDLSFWVEVLELNLPHAPISDLLFYPGDALQSLGITDGKRSDLSPEDILRIARSIPPPESIPLGPPTRHGGSG